MCAEKIWETKSHETHTSKDGSEDIVGVDKANISELRNH
jgi:hypothetical protein